MTTVAKRADVPIDAVGVGTVQAYQSVLVRARVDGELMAVPVTEGQMVRKGDLIASIDPRPYQATLDQAKARLAQDAAQLSNAQRDLVRYTSLARQDFASRQQLDTQQALVNQYAATVQGDAAAVEAAQLNLVYCSITSPVDGRVGLRQVDPGNLVHATDTGGILTITQVQPIALVFTLPQTALPAIEAGMTQGEASSGQAPTDQGPTGRAMTTQGSTGQVSTDQGFTGRGMTTQDSTGQGTTGQAQYSQPSAVQTSASQAAAHQPPTVQATGGQASRRAQGSTSQPPAGLTPEAQLPVRAYGSDNKTELSHGVLLTPDNTIDTATGTIKLKAVFANQDKRLWPGQFVNAHLQISVARHSVTLPPQAVQHGPDGLYVYVVKPDRTVAEQPVSVGYQDDKAIIITAGLSGGETVVLSGQSRLQPGTHVAPTAAAGS